MNTLDRVRPVARHLYRTATSPLRTLPDFLIIGVQKGGTTSLYRYLNEHPNIGGANIKEVDYFGKYYRRGLSWYRAQFPTLYRKRYTRDILKENYILGEASPNYFFQPHVPERVARVLPQAKLIVLLRNPVERAYSHYRHNATRGFEHASFAEAVASEEQRIQAEREKALRDEWYYSTTYMRQSYLAKGIYVDQLKHWLEFFPREQVLVLKSEDLYEEPERIYKQTLAFLAVPPLVPESLQKGFQQHNKSEDSLPGEIDPQLREQLLAYFEPYNARLYECVGRDFGWR
jgi:hypothetical protein